MRKLGAAIALVAVWACGGKADRRDKAPSLGEQMDEAKDRWAIDSARMEADRAAAAAPSELAGSTWRLVRLQSSDDKVFTPEQAAVYTVEFGRDRRMSVVAGCNRGSGTWTTTPPSGLAFGPVATTRAMCPPKSMSARFLGDFQHMRSYVIVGGHLHISLLADGGIYEFVPEEEVAEEAPPGGASVAPVIFRCTDSTGARSRILATFSAGTPGRVTLTRGGKTASAPQVRSASGAKYEASGVMFWNKGRDAMVTWFGTALNCARTKE
jgi:heat shock protein HslJ